MRIRKLHRSMGSVLTLSCSSGMDRCENIVNNVINFLNDYRNRGRRKRCLDAWLQQRTRQEKLSFGNLKKKILPKLFPKKAVPHKLKVGPNKLKVGPNKLKVGPNKLKVCPNKLKVGPNKLKVSPNKSKVNPNKLKSPQRHARLVE